MSLDRDEENVERMASSSKAGAVEFDMNRDIK